MYCESRHLKLRCVIGGSLVREIVVVDGVLWTRRLDGESGGLLGVALGGSSICISTRGALRVKRGGAEFVGLRKTCLR